MRKAWDILVIDDEQVIVDAVTKICGIDNYTVDTALSINTGFEKIAMNYYPIIICDIMMPDGNGFQVLEQICDKNIDSTVIMTTGFSTVENAVNSLYKGAIDFIPKPFTVDELLNAVYRANKYQLINKKRKQIIQQQQKSELLYVDCPTKYFRLGYSSWMFKDKEGSVLIGICDLYLKTIDSVIEFELQNIDEELMQGISSTSLISKDERFHKVLSPISGRIVEVNENIKRNPSLIEKDPYFKGWIYRIIPANLEYEIKYLIPCSSDRL